MVKVQKTAIKIVVRQVKNWSFRHVIVVTILSTVLACSLLVLVFQIPIPPPPPDELQCYQVPQKLIINSTTIILNEIQDVRFDLLQNGIFFHQTSCTKFLTSVNVWLTAREACAIESAARHNPSRHVFILFTSPQSAFHDSYGLNAFYPNLHFLRIDLMTYLSGTPLVVLLENGALANSIYVVSHTSDVLRYLTLWKYSGTYLDLDVVVLKALRTGNYAAYESDNNVAAGILSFTNTPYGRNLSLQCVTDLKRNFDGERWGFNGPGTITRLFEKLCTTSAPPVNTSEYVECGKFRAYKSYLFYPVHWERWHDYFTESKSTIAAVKNAVRQSYIVHMWNKHSERTKLGINSSAIYTQLARQHCPVVWHNCDKYF